MTAAEYQKLYETDPEIKAYVKRMARGYKTTDEVILKWKVAQLYMDNHKVGDKKRG